MDCLNGDRARRIGDLVRLRGDLDRATRGGEKRREMFSFIRKRRRGCAVPLNNKNHVIKFCFKPCQMEFLTIE